MPTVQAATDSPPATRSPMPKRQFKRTSSACSTASLPTPPPTKHRKRKRGQSRSSVYDTESEGEEEDDRDDVLPVAGIRKKRRTGLDELAASLAEASARQEREEDAFWLSTERAGEPEKPKSKGKGKRVSIVESPPPLLLRSNRVKAPMSPPPSRRRTRVAAPTTPKAATTEVGSLSLVAEVPVTPPRPTVRSKGKEKAQGPIRDSAHNPFLVDDDVSPVSSPLGPRTPKPHVEKPTLTYVFRGVKTTFANPLYDLDPTEVARSLLPPEHPDFEPSEACPPKLLFPTAPRTQPGRKAKTIAVAATAATLAPRTPSPRRGRTAREQPQETPRTPRGRTVKRVPSVRKEKVDGAQAALKANGPVRSTRKSTQA